MSADINENEKGNYKRRGVVPRFSDAELMALSVADECLNIGSENYFFSKLASVYKHGFENISSRRQYNGRRKLLFEQTEQTRKLMSVRCNAHADLFTIDAMPLEIWKISKEQRNKMGKESEHHSPYKGTVYCRRNISMVTNSTMFALHQG